MTREFTLEEMLKAMREDCKRVMFAKSRVMHRDPQARDEYQFAHGGLFYIDAVIEYMQPAFDAAKKGLYAQ